MQNFSLYIHYICILHTQSLKLKQKNFMQKDLWIYFRKPTNLHLFCSKDCKFLKTIKKVNGRNFGLISLFVYRKTKNEEKLQTYFSLENVDYMERYSLILNAWIVLRPKLSYVNFNKGSTFHKTIQKFVCFNVYYI